MAFKMTERAREGNRRRCYKWREKNRERYNEIIRAWKAKHGKRK
jgi:hypothetical protein